MALSKLKWLSGGRERRDGDRGLLEGATRCRGVRWRRPPRIPTEVFLLPAAYFAEKDGTFTNSSRWLQWKWAALDPPGEAKADQEILARSFPGSRELYQRRAARAGAVAQHGLGLREPSAPRSLEEVAKELNGPDDGRPGAQVDGFGELKDDGSTLCGNWLHSGFYTEAGNMMARRGQADPTGLGMYPNWASAGRPTGASCTTGPRPTREGKPWDPRARASVGTGSSGWATCRTSSRTLRPSDFGAFIMLPEGVAKLFAPDFNEGPFPEHYEPVEAPVANPLHPDVSSNPVAKMFRGDKDATGSARTVPYVCATYRLTEHFHYWTKHVQSEARHSSRASSSKCRKGWRGRRASRAARVRVTSARGSGRGRGHGHATRAAARGRTARRSSRSASHPLGIVGDRVTGSARQHADAVGAGSQHLDAGVQGVPGAGWRRRLGGAPWPATLEIRRSSASLWGEPHGHASLPVVAKVHRHHDLHRLQGLRGGLPGVERPGAYRVPTKQTGTYQTMPDLGTISGT